MEELVVVFTILTIATAVTLSIFITYKPSPKLDTLSIHLAIVEVTSSPINEVIINVVIPEGIEVVFEGHTIVVRNSLVDPRVLAFNYTGIVREVAPSAIVYNPSRVWFVERVSLYRTSTIKIINRFGKIRVIPIGG